MIDIDRDSFEEKARIRVIGVGGGGNNAVDRMIADNIEGIDFINVNTDAQVLKRSNAGVRIQLGTGLGAGGDPDIGAKEADESKDKIAEALQGVDMLFITAGMGGGTGTGAAPIVAAIAKKLNILTVGIVTTPFGSEGAKRMKNALKGIEELKKNIDTLVVVPNEKLIEILDEDITFIDALKEADQVLSKAVFGIFKLITDPGLLNLDFADVKSTMLDKGVAHIGIGQATGKNRSTQAVEMAVNSPLLETSIKGARNALINITTSPDFKLKEANEINKYVGKHMGVEETNIISGVYIDETLQDEIIVTLIATDFEIQQELPPATKNIVHQGAILAQKAEEKAEMQESILPTGDEVKIDLPNIFSSRKKRL